MSGLLGTKRLVKPWGRRDLPAPFAHEHGEPVGEIWFDPPPPMESVLAKYLFTGERLSVQVHPRAQYCPMGLGKDECWLVTEALPGAQLAVGFREEVSPQIIRAAALDGSIEDMLEWIEVGAGDFLYVPSGTVHSMGPGLTIVEVQQNSDITYRLYDYGRPRALHLDEAMASILPGRHPENLRSRVEPEQETVLVDGEYFRLAHCVGAPGELLAQSFAGPIQIIPLAGSCAIGASEVRVGDSGWADRLEEVDFANSQRCLLVANPQSQSR